MKKLLIYIYSFLLMFIFIGTEVVAQESVITQEVNRIDGYLQLAAENNPELKAIFNQYLATLERLPQAKALPDPSVMFNVFTSPVETRVGAQRAGISISQAFPWFGQLRSQENAVAQLAKARYQAFEEAKNKLFFDVRATRCSFQPNICQLAKGL